MKNFLLLSLLLVMALTLIACGNDHSEARLRIVHDSANAPNVDVLVNGSSVATNVAYKADSGYLTIPSGATQIQVRPTGTSTNVIDAKITTVKKTDYTVLATNLVA